MIRVVLVEDQTIVRRGIISLLHLTEDIRVVAEAKDGEEAVAVLKNTDFDVALLDIRLPKYSGIRVLEILNEAGEVPAAIMLTTFDDDPVFLQAVRAGARGFLLKDVSVEHLATCIRTVAGGGAFLEPAVTERVIRAIRGRQKQFDPQEKLDPLTPREKDVLRLIAGGYSNREIGEALHLSEGSVKNHTSSILSKLGARDRTRAVLRAIELGAL